MSQAPSAPSRYGRSRTPNAIYSLSGGESSASPVVAFATPPCGPEIQYVAAPWSVSLHDGHPLSILQRLLDDIKRPESRHYARYGEFVTTEGNNLIELLKRCVRQEAWQHLTSSQRQPLRASTPALKALGGDLRYHGRAIYLHILEFTDGTVRLYVGQAYNLAARVNNQHVDFRYRRDHPSLHNFAMDRSTSDTFIILAQLKETTQSDLVLNLLEMWMALCFKTMPDEIVEAWLGPYPSRNHRGHGIGVDTGKIYGLNVASPLDQGDKEAWKGSFQMCKESRDEMAREYFWDTKRRPRPVFAKAVAKATWIQYLPHFLAVATVAFVVGRWSARFRRTS
jgi:hypothetical protein